MPALDPFAGRSPGEAAPYENAQTVTPSDTAELPVIPALIALPSDADITSGHAVRVEMMNGQIITVWLAHPAAVGFVGAAVPVRCKRILATGTTAPRVTLFW